MAAKILLDAKKLLADIDSGMSDSDLMIKYAVSPEALKEAFRQLEHLGFLRRIKASELIQDLRHGKTNNEIMKKYRLSKRALKQVFQELTQAGISFSAKREGTHARKRVSVSEIMSDIHLGFLETEIMEKHELTYRGLRSLFWKLVASRLITWDQLIDLFPSSGVDTVRQRVRRFPRSYPVISLRIRDKTNSRNHGRIIDFSEKGMGVIGISVKKSETKSLIIVPDEIAGFDSLHLVAKCRWCRTRKLRPHSPVSK